MLLRFIRTLFFIFDRDGNGLIKLPGKNWSTAFPKRHPELKATTLQALEWDRHEHFIYEKVIEWYTVIKNPALKPRNVYNMNETGVLLAVLNSLKVLVSSDNLQKCRGTGKDSTKIIVINTKLYNAAENAFALLLDENQLLFEQTC
jgi:hypothetical protein